MNKKYGVLGGGSWGTALVKILTDNKCYVNWYVRNKENVMHIKKYGKNFTYLRSVNFDIKKIHVSDSIEEITQQSDIIILAIPSPFLEKELLKIQFQIINKIVFSALKGVIPKSNLIVSEHLNSFYNIPITRIGIITGPCHAEEVALEKLSYLTVASKNKSIGEEMKGVLTSSYIRVKFSEDTMGAEYASMLKNIYALTAGIAHGLNYGDNFQSVLISNSVKEMKRFINSINKVKRDINDSEYLGDLLVTAYSAFSRNRTLGNMLGKGYSLKAAFSEMSMISEGYYATKNAFNIVKKSSNEFPIIHATYGILYKNLSPKKLMKTLSEKLN
ncbi:MAG: glycerol-3-phosphate dehydrogenase [Bacteroidetes bacterium]|nr:glycerol-3-phosphate dehydrogenase [Bacteroidota bacterium]